MNYLAILACAVLSMVIGAIWYGPMFGRKWMEIVGANPDDQERRKQMQKEAMPLYIIQFILTLVQVYVLNGLLIWTNAAGKEVPVALWICFGLIMPVVAGSAMWNNDPKKVVWARFLIQMGYQFILFLVFGYVLGAWK